MEGVGEDGDAKAVGGSKENNEGEGAMNDRY